MGSIHSYEEQLTLLNQLPNALNSLNFKDLKDKIIQIAADIVQAEGASLLLLDKEKQELYFDTLSNDSKSLMTIRVPVGEGIAGRVAETRESEIINKMDDSVGHFKKADKTTGIVTRNLVAIPLETNDSLIGVLETINKKEGEFTKLDSDALTLVGAFMASSLEKAAAFEALEEKSNQIKEAYHIALDKLMELSRYNDPETVNHMSRVGEMAALLGKHYGLSNNEVELIKEAAPMHDIGKTGIPDYILKKPGKFTDDERDFMKKHTTIGYNVLNGTDQPLFDAAAIIALEHQEKFDGTGYPQNLKGDEIHIYSRLTAIADVFDALVSKRPYKEPWPIEKALAIIKEERGKHFDPTIVDLFFKHKVELLAIQDRLVDTDQDFQISYDFK